MFKGYKVRGAQYTTYILNNYKPLPNLEILRNLYLRVQKFSQSIIFFPGKQTNMYSCDIDDQTAQYVFASKGKQAMYFNPNLQ